MVGPIRSVALAACLLVIPLHGVCDAAGTPREATECAAAYVAAQQFRLQGKLLLSHRQLLVCSRDACAASLRLDCLRWLSEVDLATPTLVFAVQGPDGQDLTAVKVVMDGEDLADHVGGEAIPVDLGPHTLRFEAPGFGSIDEHVVVREGEKAREIRVLFPRAVGTPPGQAPSREGPGGPRGGVTRVASYVLGATGVTVLALGSYFEVTGLARRSDLFSCAPPGCSEAQFDATKQSAQHAFLAGDILVGAGIASLAAATIAYLSSRPSGPRRGVPQIGVVPTSGGAVGTLGGRF